MGMTLLILVFVIFSSFCGLQLFIFFSTRFGLNQASNQRSLHVQPTPSGGGVVLALVTVVTVAFLVAESDLKILFSVTASFILSLVGFWDDRNPLPAKLRLLFQFAFSVSVLYIFFEPELPAILWLALGAVGLVWWLNLFNFMDGSDGFATAEAIFILTALLMLLLLAGKAASASNVFVAVIGVVYTTLFVFMCLNFPPARLFLGDAGSYWLAAVIASLMLYGVSHEVFSLGVCLMLPASFIVDATLTLIERSMRGENIFEAHRSHLYQRLCLTFEKQLGTECVEGARSRAHRRVVYCYALVNFVLVLPLTIWSAYFSELSYYAFFVLYGLLVGLFMFARMLVRQEK